MRAIWKGSINFGLVNIPVAVYSATKEEKIAFKQLRKSDLSPITYKKAAVDDEKAVADEEIVKGYEYEKGKFVVLSEEDFAKVEIESTHTIEITDFVEQADIHTKYFYKSYFLEAQKGGEKGYALLLRALTETGKLGIAKVSIRSKEYLAAVKPDGLFLMLELMHFAQSILEPEGLNDVSGITLAPKEITMAKQLIEMQSGPFEPEKYEDRYQVELRAIIEAKIKKAPIPAKAKARALPSDVSNIVAILQQSLDESAGKKKKAPGVRPASRSTAKLVKQKRRVGSLG